MQIFDNVSQIHRDDKTVITIGTFDGIHPGHKKIIDKVKEEIENISGRGLLITFHPHPRNVVKDGFKLKILTTTNEKLELLETMGIENVLVINFTREFSQLSSREFFQNYIINGTGISEIVIGHDHHFGKDRSGNIETLKELGDEFSFKVTRVGPVEIDNEIISSTKIRNALGEGNLTRAHKLLGRNYSFSGKVVEGDKRGRLLGFPTANIKLNENEKLLPALGIYLVGVYTGGKKYYGLLSVGKRPTFYVSGEIVPEVYIYDFDKDIYGMNIEVELIERLRGEEKYNSADELIVQMNKDKAKGLEYLSKLINPG